jgi:hypothetical protein
VGEVHAALEEPEPSPVIHRPGVSMGGAPDRDFLRFVAREETVRALVDALR